jgi:hypothetical protein
MKSQTTKKNAIEEEGDDEREEVQMNQTGDNDKNK